MATEVDFTKLRVKLQIKDRFLACIAMMLKWVPDDEVLTAGTDGTTLYYNPSWFSNLSQEEQLGIIAHECMHVALQHPVRCEKGNFKHDLYNICADYVVNRELVKHKFKLPEGGFECPYNYWEMCTEEIYKDLEDNNAKHPDPDLLSTKQDTVQITKDLRKILAQAVIQSKGSKNFSTECNEFKRAYDELFKPKLPWDVLLSRYVNGFVKEDYSWRKPNRRYLEVGYLPSINESEILTKINVYMDVSGSVEQSTINKFLSEIKGFYTFLKPEELRINFFSVGLDNVIVMKDHWIDNFDISTKGGTDITGVIYDINKQKACINIVFTDAYMRGEKHIEEAKYPILWVIYDHKGFTPKKGKVIEIDL